MRFWPRTNRRTDRRRCVTGPALDPGSQQERRTRRFRARPDLLQAARDRLISATTKSTAPAVMAQSSTLKMAKS